MPASRVLVVDDELQMRRLLIISLSSRGYVVEAAASGQEGIDKLSVMPFDILLLDLGLPDMDGTDVCRTVRGWSSIPIIVVSVRDQDSDKVAALDLGADDFVTKPFSIDELLARMRANLRRTTEAAGAPVITLGSLVVDLARRLVVREGHEVHLTPTEFALLRVLVTHGGRVLTHRHLLREIRGPTYEDETALLRVHMVALRQKLAMPPGVPGYIATEPGIGYRLHV
ncbi:MAG: two-component system response regulator KdpE [Chloroflexota bacterium]